MASGRGLAAAGLLVLSVGVSACGPQSEAMTPQSPSAQSSQSIVAEAGTEGPVCSGYVALTFDDGPSVDTPRLLETLDELGLKATFFNMGYMTKRFPDHVRQMVADGHEIGNHTANHPHLTTLSEAEIRREIVGQRDIERSLGITDVRLFRPPHGETNPTVGRVAKELGLLEVLWSTDTKDWTKNSAHEITDLALQVQAGGIIDLHDQGGLHAIEALPAIAAGLKARGLCAGRVVATSQVQTSQYLGLPYYAVAVRW